MPVEYRHVAFVAVIGAGPVGGALVQKLALRDRIGEVRLIDPQPGIAQGKALDILQSSPVEAFSTRLVAAQSLHSAAGASAIVLADSGATGAEHAHEPGFALLRQIAAFERSAPIVFAGAEQRTLMALAVAELSIGRSRVLGTSPAALESALRTLTGLALDTTGVEVQLRLVGAPPDGVVVGWEEATASALPLRTQLSPHKIRALNDCIPKLWPPGPLALASAAARAVEAIVNGSRRALTCFVSLDAGPTRNAVAAMPTELGTRGVARILEPALSRLERTQMETAIERLAVRGSQS
jgi:malate dehydrogenase